MTLYQVWYTTEDGFIALSWPLFLMIRDRASSTLLLRIVAHYYLTILLSLHLFHLLFSFNLQFLYEGAGCEIKILKELKILKICGISMLSIFIAYVPYWCRFTISWLFYEFCNVYFRCFYSPNGPSV